MKTDRSMQVLFAAGLMLTAAVALAQDRQVAGQRGRLARDVDDPLRPGFDERVHHRPSMIWSLGILRQCEARRLYAGGDHDGSRCTCA